MQLINLNCQTIFLKYRPYDHSVSAIVYLFQCISLKVTYNSSEEVNALFYKTELLPADISMLKAFKAQVKYQKRPCCDNLSLENLIIFTTLYEKGIYFSVFVAGNVRANARIGHDGIYFEIIQANAQTMQFYDNHFENNR